MGFHSGPPAYAPAHGYRRKQIGGFELVFDVGLGVYVAVGVTDVYYHDGYFYRCRAGVWEISLRGVTWEAAGIGRLPPGLQVKARSMLKLNGNAGKSGVNSDGITGKPNSAPDAAPAKANGAADANAGKSGGTAGANAAKPAGNAGANLSKPDANPAGANKPAAKTAASPKPAGKGKRK